MKTIVTTTHYSALRSMSSAGAFNDSTGDSQRIYGDGTNSSIGPQINTYYFDKKALIDIAKEQYFGQLASMENMPKQNWAA